MAGRKILRRLSFQLPGAPRADVPAPKEDYAIDPARFDGKTAPRVGSSRAFRENFDAVFPSARPGRV